MDKPHRMVDMRLGRIVIREGSDRQYIYLTEREGPRGFPIVIGTNEAHEIHRVVTQESAVRPMTHQLAAAIIDQLGADVERCDIVDMRDNTYFAQLVLKRRSDGTTAVVDARPSDAIALALRGRAPIRVTEDVLDQCRTDNGGPDPLPDPTSDED